jgi:IclR family KDG regulon transcriptional repressor
MRNTEPPLRREQPRSQSSDKLLKIIECLAASRLPVRLMDLSETLGLPQPTVLRYLKTLCELGYAYRDGESACYGLTWRLCRLSDAVQTNLVLRSMASPFLNALANQLNTGVCLVVEQGGQTLYLDYVDNPRIMTRTMLHIGKSAPIHATGSGKVLLSAYSNRRIRGILEENGMEQLTPKTITDPDRLLQEIERIRQQEYGIDREECESGYTCVSVPLRDYSGRIAAAVSVFDMSEHFTEARIQQEVLPAMHSTGAQISYRMGFEK